MCIALIEQVQAETLKAFCNGRIFCAEQLSLYRQRFTVQWLSSRKVAHPAEQIGQFEHRAGRLDMLVTEQLAAHCQCIPVILQCRFVFSFQFEDIAEPVHRPGHFQVFITKQCTALVESTLQQTRRLVIKPEAHVDRTHCFHQGRLDCWLC